MAGLEETFGSSVNARIAAHATERGHHPVDDFERIPEPDVAPVPGAQWDELHGRWEIWNEELQAWQVVGDDTGSPVRPPDENPLPWLLTRELHHAEEVEAAHPSVPDIERASPLGPAPPGAQWNEVTSRWERWDDAAATWVEATADDDG